MSQQAQPEAQVHVFAVAEEILIEAAGFQKQVAAVKGCGGAGCENLPLGRKAAHRCAMMPAPDQPAGMVDIAGAVQTPDVSGIDLGRSEHDSIGMAGGGIHQLGQPFRLREGIGVQRGDPRRSGLRDAQVVSGGETQIGAGSDDLHAAGLHDGKIVQARYRAIRGAVINNDDFLGEQGLAAQRFDAPVQQRAAIVVHDDDADGGLG